MPLAASHYAQGPEALVAGLAARGDRLAFAELVRRSQAAIRQDLQRRCDDDVLADELARLAYQRAWRRIRRLRAPEQFPAWMDRIASQQWRRYQRGQVPYTDAATRGSTAEQFTASVMARVAARRRRVLLGRVAIAALLVLLEILLDSPVQNSVGQLTRMLGTPLFEIDQAVLKIILAPVNSVAGLLGCTLLGLQLLYRKLFC